MKVYVEYENIKSSGIPEVDSLHERISKLHADLVKYQAMWALRSIEDEIKESGGIIIIKGSQIHTKHFTRELTDKIIDLLTDTAFPSSL